MEVGIPAYTPSQYTTVASVSIRVTKMLQRPDQPGVDSIGAVVYWGGGIRGYTPYTNLRVF